MHDDELTCGQELAASAEVPQALGALLTHVAINLRAHANWVGTDTEGARRECEAMLQVAHAYESLGAAAAQTASTVRSMKDLDQAPHDPAKFDRNEFATWMRTKVKLQRDLANMLLIHASKAEHALEQISEPRNDRW